MLTAPHTHESFPLQFLAATAAVPRPARLRQDPVHKYYRRLSRRGQSLPPPGSQMSPPGMQPPDAPASGLRDLSPTDASSNKRHLLLMLNGLNGAAANWDVVTEKLEELTDLSHVALLASTTNSRLQVCFCSWQSASLC